MHDQYLTSKNNQNVLNEPKFHYTIMKSTRFLHLFIRNKEWFFIRKIVFFKSSLIFFWNQESTDGKSLHFNLF